MAGIDPSNVPYLDALAQDGIPTVVAWETPGETLINTVEDDSPLQTRYMPDAELVVGNTCAVRR